MKLSTSLAALVLCSFSMTANAVLIEVTVNGSVEYNQINSGPLSGAVSGDAASISFLLDSDNFVDSTNFPTRGYAIDTSSFLFTAGANSVGMQNPLPAGVTPYFIIRNDDPAVDGFFIGTNVDGSPNGAPSDSAGLFGQFMVNFLATYNNDPLSSLDILGALGTYDFTGLTSFNFTVDDGPFNAMGLDFEQMTIAEVAMPMPEPTTLWLAIPGVLAFWQIQRRKRN